jgi:hypothetical protein
MQVLEIRSSNISQRKLAIIYGVKHPTNWAFTLREIWIWRV